jgi:hypothetical protein
MQQLPNCTFMLFYSNYNPESLRVKIALHEIVEQFHQVFTIEVFEVDYDQDKTLCNKYNVSGLPTLLIFRNQHLLDRYFGELDSTDFEHIIKDLLKN